MTKYCEDCRWVNNDSGFAQCDSPKNLETRLKGDALVSRNRRHTRKWETCSWMRGVGFVESLFMDCCGKRGRWFEKHED